MDKNSIHARCSIENSYRSARSVLDACLMHILRHFRRALSTLRRIVSIIAAMAANGTRIAYIVVYVSMLTVGLLVDVPVWLGVLVGVLVMLPVVTADWLLSTRKKVEPQK